MKALKVLKQALKRYLVHENDLREAIDELEVLQKSEQKSYAIGYTQGYLDCENNKTPKDIRELLRINNESTIIIQHTSMGSS